MHSNVWRDKNLCDQRLTHIIRINKSRAEIYNHNLQQSSYPSILLYTLIDTKNMHVYSNCTMSCMSCQNQELKKKPFRDFCHSFLFLKLALHT